MEKYGVCSNCHGRPTSALDLDGFTKTAEGHLECTKCGQTVMTGVILEDTITVEDTVTKKEDTNEEEPDI